MNFQITSEYHTHIIFCINISIPKSLFLKAKRINLLNNPAICMIDILSMYHILTQAFQMHNMNEKKFLVWKKFVQNLIMKPSVKECETNIKKGLSQMQLTELSNLNLNNIPHIECRNTKLSLPSITAITNALNVTVDYFLMDAINNSLIQFKRKLVKCFDNCSKEEYTLLSDICKTTLKIYREIQKRRISNHCRQNPNRLPGVFSHKQVFFIILRKIINKNTKQI